jgi:DNA-binding PadR family transcriptional regulator
MQPMTGYALRAAIRDTLGHFWSESFGQIYPALSRLEAEGMVTRDDGGRFSLTPSGRRHLRRRLAEPVEAVPPRNGVLLRLFFGRALGPDACLRLVEDTEAQAEQSLALLADVRADLEGEPQGPDHPYVLLTVSAGEAAARARLEWAAHARAVLESLSAR